MQINIVKYDANREIVNTYENLQIVQSQFFTNKLIFIYIHFNLSIGLSVFRFIANTYKQRAIWLHLTICNIRSAIRWAIMKVILNYLLLPTLGPGPWMSFHYFCPKNSYWLVEIKYSCYSFKVVTSLAWLGLGPVPQNVLRT